MSQYQRMVSYLYEYKQGVKGVNVGYVRIEQRGTGCRISLQMRRRNLGQLSDVAVFRQRRNGIRYYTIGTLTEKNGDYRCRIETESGNIVGSGINFSDVDGIVIYQDDTYYIATTWKNQTVYLGESRIWDPEEIEDSEDLETMEPELAESVEIPEDDRMVLEQSDIKAVEEEVLGRNDIPQTLGGDDPERYGQQLLHGDDSENHGQPVLKENEKNGQQIADKDSMEQHDSQQFSKEEQQFSKENEEQEEMQSTRESGETGKDTYTSPGQNNNPGMKQIFPKWTGMPLFRRRPMGNGNIPIPQMAEWSNGNRHMAESVAEKHAENMGDVTEQPVNRSSCENKEEIEEQAVCRNCPFKRKNIDYGKRILMTFPFMRPFPNEQQLACVRIEPQDLGCLPMQMWTLANNHFLLQGYYCYRHLIFMETGKQGYALGVPGIYDRRTSRQAEQFGFIQFRAICSGKQCDGAFGYWLMPLSC